MNGLPTLKILDKIYDLLIKMDERLTNFCNVNSSDKASTLNFLYKSCNILTDVNL